MSREDSLEEAYNKKSLDYPIWGQELNRENGKLGSVPLEWDVERTGRPWTEFGKD